MSHPDVFRIFEHTPLNSLQLDSLQLNSLQQEAMLVDALLADCDFDRTEAKRLVRQAQQAPSRCQISKFYIQAIATPKTKFLFTNLRPGKGMQSNTMYTNWLIGRNSTCAITIRDWSVSRCHAVMGHHILDGFYLTDLGSSNGTQVNRHRLHPHTRKCLRDGDLLQLGNIQVEFFIANATTQSPVLQHAAYLQEVTYS
jgi:hypothetical protein